jgi:hypothetical protein
VVAYVVLLILLPVLGVTGSMAAGWWSTTGRAAAAAPGASRADEPAGSPSAVTPADPANVKGSMTVQQVADAFPPVTAAEIVAAFGAPADTPSSAQLKSLVESGSGMEIPAFRTWLDRRRAP